MTATAQLFLAEALVKSASAHYYRFQAAAPLEVAMPAVFGAGGALVRAAIPTEADRRHRRGIGARMLRGLGRGAAVGAGTAFGGDLGTAVGGHIGPGADDALGMLGSAAGAWAGYRIPEQKNQYD